MGRRAGGEIVREFSGVIAKKGVSLVEPFSETHELEEDLAMAPAC